MARCRCSGRALCLCLLPFLMMSHLLVYIMVTIFVAMSYTPEPKPLPLPLHFIAPGTWSNSGALASHPMNAFWNLRLVEGALWNRLQHLKDRENNPILRGNTTAGRGPGTESTRMHGIDSFSPCKPDHLWASQLPDFNTMPEQMKDFVLSMHCRNYTLLKNQPDMCNGQDTEPGTLILFMAIKSQVGNFENRQAIRETWGKTGWAEEEAGGERWQVRTVFLLGRQDLTTGPHPDLEALLQLESTLHKDILQWDFRDTFFNLTLKDVLFWDWLSVHCPQAHYIFKGDDDVFVRTGALLDFLKKHHAPLEGTNKKVKDDFLVGDVIPNAWPSRQPTAKYYIPESFYKGVYPTYAGGGGVVYSFTLAMRLRAVSNRVNLFPIDDVYMGMCLQRLGVSPSHNPGFLTFDLPEASREKPCAYRKVLLVHKRSPREMLTLWRDLKALIKEC
ncbi:N-acetyllactosaminide beta-1,3-N-acetylglucosaminyltransferase 2 [Silurus meridionalis]|nr:N-acetyllactosaminide beta-1,3-N-acetylglucosaminyltransferase 2 [Silurus meridionalis]